MRPRKFENILAIVQSCVILNNIAINEAEPVPLCIDTFDDDDVLEPEVDEETESNDTILPNLRGSRQANLFWSIKLTEQFFK